MRGRRLIVSAAVVAVVAGPGLAMAQDGPPTDTPPTDTPPVEAPGTQAETDGEQPGAAQAEDLTAEEAEGDGADVSALAECLPSGAELHGTGFNKGFIMRQAARSGEVQLSDDGPVMPIDDPTALCNEVQRIADAATAPDTAKGRPDWAGPKDKDRGKTGAAGVRRGPPPHANKGGDNVS